MNIHSAKAKGKKLQIYVRNKLREIFSSKLEGGDIETTISSEAGIDIKLSPAAKKKIPFDIEAKNTETFNRNSAINQAEKNSVEKNRIPMVVFSKNRNKTYCIIEINNLKSVLKKKKSN